MISQNELLMIKLSKKLINLMTTSFVAIAIIGAICSNLLINKNKVIVWDNKYFRGKNYYHFPIINQLKNNVNMNNLIKIICNSDKYNYIISEENFKNNMKEILQSTLKNIKMFSSSYLSYKIECNYKILNNKEVNMDIVWYLPSNYLKYYDQFTISLDID